jgi:DNA repair protein RecO (recombination protein O)
MRYVSLSDFEKIFSFSLTDDALKSFSVVSEGYLLHKTERKFKTLDFYKTITGI